MRSANIADLRNHLTQYLREVRAGNEIIVRDRKRPIAKIVPFKLDDVDAEEAELVSLGLMTMPERKLPASFWKARRPAVSLRAAVKAVTDDRDEGW